MEEMRQSLRIMDQCINKMPAGEYKVRKKSFDKYIDIRNSLIFCLDR